MPDYVPIQDLTIVGSVGDNDLFPLSDGSGAYAVRGGTIKSWATSDAVAAAADAAASKTAAQNAATAAGEAQSAAEDAAAEAAEATGELKNDLSATDESISNEFKILIGNNVGVFNSGYYITPLSVGGAVTRGKDSGYVTALIPVVPGDKVTLNATGGVGTQRLYVWIDSSGKSLNLASTNLSGERTITAPENAVYLAINNKLASQQTGYYAYKGSKPTFVKYEGVLTSAEDVDNYKNSGCYRWADGSIPVNSPTSVAGSLFVCGASGFCSQTIINKNGLMWVRGYYNSSWTDWIRITDKNVFDDRIKTLSYQPLFYPTTALNLVSGNLTTSGGSNNDTNGIRSASGYSYLPVIHPGDFYYCDPAYSIRVGIYSSTTLTGANFIGWASENYQSGVVGIPPEYEGNYAAVTIKKIGYESADISGDVSTIGQHVKYFYPTKTIDWDSASIIPGVDAFYFDWSIGYTISSTGVYGTNSKYAVTDMIPVREGNVIYNNTTGYGKDNYATVIMLALYSNNVFVVRKGLSTGSKYIVEEGYDGMRIIYGYTSDSANAPAMTRSLLNDYFSVRFMKEAVPMGYTGDGERPYYVAFGASTTIGAVHHYSGENITYSRYNYPAYIGRALGLKTYNLGVGSTGLMERGDPGESYGTKNNIMDQIISNDGILSKAGLITLMFARGNDVMVGDPPVAFPIGEYDDYYPYDEEGYNWPGGSGLNQMVALGATTFGCLNWCIRYLNQHYPKAQLIVIFGSPSANTNPRLIDVVPNESENEEENEEETTTAPYKLVFGDFSEQSEIKKTHDEFIKLRNALNVPMIDLYYEGNAFTSYSTYAKDPDDGSYVLFSTVGTRESPAFDTHPNDEGYKRFARYLTGKVISLFDH